MRVSSSRTLIEFIGDIFQMLMNGFECGTGEALNALWKLLVGFKVFISGRNFLFTGILFKARRKYCCGHHSN